MFTIVGKQTARHDSGYVVEVLDRQTVQYVDASCRATINVEFGPTTAVYANSLAMTCSGHGDATSSGLAEAVRDRVVKGLGALGLSCELVISQDR